MPTRRLTSSLVLAALALASPAAAAPPTALYVPTGPANTVAQFDIGAGGLLAPLSPATVSQPNPGDAVITPDGKHVYSVSGANLYLWDVQSDRTLVAHNPATFAIPSGGTLWIAISPDGKSLYAPDYHVTGSVAQLTIAANGDLSAKTPASVPAGVNTFSVGMTPDGKHLYALNVGDNTISVYAVAADGTLTASGPVVTTGATPSHMAVTPDGRFAYVTDDAANTVDQYAIGSDGGLTPLTPARVVTSSAGSPAPDGIAVTPDGKTVYVSNIGDDPHGVAQFDVGPDGTLSAKTPDSVPSSLALMITPTPDGSSVYVASIGGHAVQQFTASSSGALTAKSPASVSTGGVPEQLLVTPDQGPTAAFTAPASSAAGQSASFDGSSSSDADGTIAHYDWDFGDGATAADAGAVVSHAFAAAGTYTVRLRVTDDSGCAGEIYTGRGTLCNDHGAVVTHDVVVPAGTPPGSHPTGDTPRPTGDSPRPKGRPKARCKVPQLKRLPLAKARKRLRKAHCRLGKVTRSAGERPVVVRQRPAAGKRRKKGARVAVWVSGRA